MSTVVHPSLKSLLEDLLAHAAGPDKPTLRDIASFTGINEDSIYAFRRAKPEARTHPNNCYLLALADASLTKREPVARAREWLKLAHRRGDVPNIASITDEEIERGLRLVRLQRDKEAEGGLGNPGVEPVTQHWMINHTGLNEDELVNFSVDDERNLMSAWATALQLTAFEAAWVKEQAGADRCYLLTESLQVLWELVDWIVPLAEKTIYYDDSPNGVPNSLSMFIAPSELVKKDELAEIQRKMAEVIAPVEAVKAHLKVYFHEGVLPAPVSIAAFARLRSKPEGALLFGNDALTNKLVHSYLQRGSPLAEATAKARRLTTSPHRVNASLIEHLLKANHIDAKTGRGPKEWSFTPSSDKSGWKELPAPN